MSVDKLAEYDSTLREIVDKHAPLVTKQNCRKHTEPWNNETTQADRRHARTLERKWRKSRNETDKVKYYKQRENYKKSLRIAKI